MKHPAYNLRPNKAVDRSLLVERIRELEKVDLLNTRSCAYYGFGGPFLDEFRLLANYFPTMIFHSLEKNQHTYERQKFHKFSSNISLHKTNVDGFLANNDLESCDHLIWWLDYTCLGLNELRDITSLVNSLSPGSFLRVTVNANIEYEADHLVKFLSPDEVRNALNTKVTEFKSEYSSYLPQSFTGEELFDESKYQSLCVDMIVNALEKRSNLASTRIWHLGNRIYRDGVQMVTCEFYISCKQFEFDKRNKPAIRYLKAFDRKRNEAEEINVPNLSIKERLFLEARIPKIPNKIKRVAKCLGYRIDSSEKKHDEAMLQYCKYNSHYPILGKISH